MDPNVLQTMGIVFSCQPLLQGVRLEISISYRAWRIVCYVLLEGQGCSLDHPDQLPLSFILVRASKLSRAEHVMMFIMIGIFSKFNFEKKKKEAGMEPYTVTIVGTG